MRKWIIIGLLLVMASIGLMSQNIWEPVPIPATATSLGPSAIDSAGVIYLSDTNSGLWKSPDYGVHWTAINTGIDFTHEYVSSVYVDPHNDNHLIAGTGVIGGFSGTGNCHFYNSTNAGTNWTVMVSPPVLCNTWTSTSAAVAWATNGDIVLDTYLAIWRSTDGGVTATAVPNSNYTPINPKNPFSIGGPNPFGPNAGDIWIGQEDDQTLVTPPMNGVMVSGDNGIHFTNNFNCQPIHCFNHTFFEFNKNGDVFAIEEDFGIRRSQDRGFHWTTVLSHPAFKYGQPFTLGHDLTSNRNLYFGHGSLKTAPFDNSVYRSTDQGATWSPWDSGIPTNLFSIGFAWNPTDGRELAFFRNGGGVYRTVQPVGGTGPTLSLSANPSAVSVVQGNSGTSTITSTIGGGFNSAVTLTSTGVPSGTTVGFAPNPIAAPGSGTSLMTMTVGASTVPGIYPITVTGTGGGLSSNTTVTLTVTAASQPDFSISASPTTVTVQQGNSGTSTITTTVSGGFNNAITLSASGVPSGTTATFNPNPIPAPGAGSSIVTFNVGASTSTGSFPITITGTGGGLTKTTSITLTVTANGGTGTQQPTATLPFSTPNTAYTAGETALITTAKNLAKNGGCTTLNPAPHVWCVGHSTSSTASGSLFVNFGTAPAGGALAGAIAAITNNTSVNGEVVVLDSVTQNPNGYEGNGPGSVLFDPFTSTCADNLHESGLPCAIFMPKIPRPAGVTPKRLFIMSSDYANFPAVGNLAIPNVPEFTNHALGLAPGGWSSNVNPGDYARLTTHGLNFPLFISTGSDYIDWLGIEVTSQSNTPHNMVNPDGSLTQLGQTYQLVHVDGNGATGSRVIDISALNTPATERDTWKQAAEIVGNTDPTLEQDNYWVTNCNYDSLTGPPCGSVLLDPGTTPATPNSSPTRRVYITVNPATTLSQGHTEITFTWNSKPRAAFLDGTNPAFSIQPTLCADSTTSTPPGICVTDAQHGYVDVKPFQPWTVATCQSNKTCYNGGVYNFFLEVYPTGACPQAYPASQYVAGTELSACTQHVHSNDILQIAYDHTLTPQFSVACASGTTCLNANDTFSGQTPWSLMLPMVGSPVPITITGAANQTNWPAGTGTVTVTSQTGASIETSGTPVVTNLAGGVQQITGVSISWPRAFTSGFRTSLTVTNSASGTKTETINGATPTSDIAVAYKVVDHTGDSTTNPSTTRGISYCGIGNHSTNLVLRGQAITMSCFGVGTHWTKIPNCTTDPCADRAPNLANHVNLGADVDIMAHTSVSDTQMNITYWICDGKAHAGCTTGVMADAGAIGNRFVQFWVHGDHGQYINVNSTPTNQIACTPAVGDNVDTCFMKNAQAVQAGMVATGTGMVIRDGVVSDIVFPTNPGQDTQGIRLEFGIGPMLIENNGIVQGSENLFVGGVGNVIDEIQSPRDVTVHNNYLFHGQADRAWGIGLYRKRLAKITAACLGVGCTDPVTGTPGVANTVYFTGGNGLAASTYGAYMQGLTGAYAFLNTKFLTVKAVSSAGWNAAFTNANIPLDSTQNATALQYAGSINTPIWPDNNWNVTISTKPNYEQKAGTRFLIYGNIMDGQWTGVLNSYPAISLKNYCSQANGLPGASSNDVVVHDNLVLNARTMFSNEFYDTYGNYQNTPGSNQGSMPPLQGRRQIIDNNLWTSNQNEFSPVGIPGCPGGACLDVYPRWNLLMDWSQDMLLMHNTGWLAAPAAGGVGGPYNGNFNSTGVFFNNTTGQCAPTQKLDYAKNVWYLNNVFMHGFASNSGCPPTQWLQPSPGVQIWGNVVNFFTQAFNGGVNTAVNYGMVSTDTATPTFTSQISNTYANGTSFGGDYTLTGPSAIAGWIAGPNPTQPAANTTDGKTAGINMAQLIATVGNTFTGAAPGTNPAPSVITMSPLPPTAVGDVYTTTLACTGGTPPYTWAYVTGSYTNGISLDTSSGVVSGTATVAGTQSPTVKCVDSTSTSSPGATLSLVVNPAVSITTTTLPTGAVPEVYSATINATGGLTPYTWSVASGQMSSCPATTNGLCLDPKSGGITGQPVAAMTQSFTAQVTDAGGGTATQALSITINPTLIITTGSLPDGTVGVAYSQTLTATGGVLPYTWSQPSGTLCAGLSLSGAVISGSPTTAQTCTFTIQVADSGSATATKQFTINIQPAVQPLTITRTTFPIGIVNSFYTQALTATGGVPPYTWSIVQGALPTGLAISGTNITGTPTQSATFTFTLQVTDSVGTNASSPTQSFIQIYALLGSNATGQNIAISPQVAIK